MCGLEYLAELQKLGNNVPVMMISGSSNQKDLYSDVVARDGLGLVEKPFENGILGNIFREMLLNQGRSETLDNYALNQGWKT